MTKPNIIFLIQDQMQQQILEDDSFCIAPNLHALKADSLYFSEAHSCNAICSPARASLITGTLPHTHGMVDCTHTVPTYRAELDTTLETITGRLAKEGYLNAYYGKWHIERSHELEKFSISDYVTERDLPSFSVTPIDRVTMSAEGYSTKTIAGVFSEDSTHTEEHFIYDKAIAFLENNKDSGKPLCTFISTYAPHDPYCVPQEIYDLYEDIELPLPESFHDDLANRPAIYRRMKEALGNIPLEDFKKIQRCYYSYCTLVDREIARLVTYLQDTNQYDNTLIVCLSDHGDMMGAHGMLTKSVESFEEIYRIPLLMKLPQGAFQGETRDFYITTQEIAPTVLELMGLPKLGNPHEATSMVPWIRGEKIDKHFGYAEFFGQRFSYTQRIVWMDGFKYVFNGFDYDELYDLKKDPHEMTNLQADPTYHEKKVQLCKKMWEQIRATGDSTLADAEYYLMRIAPIGPGPKEDASNYATYNKQF